eukprot:761666-Hanusia_phi.AAC.3
MKFVDLASDHVYSRVVSGAIFMLIPVMLTQLYIPGSMNFAEVPSKNKVPASLLVFNLPAASSMVLGMPMTEPIKVYVRNNVSYPIIGQTLQARVSSWNPDQSFAFCGQSAYVQGTIESIRHAEICQFELKGNSVTTDDDGIGTFTELSFTRAVPGIVVIEIFLQWCADATCKTTVFLNSSVLLSVTKSTHILKSYNSAPDTIISNTRMANQLSDSMVPKVRVVDGSGNPVFNATVVIFSISNFTRYFTRMNSAMIEIFGTDRALAGDPSKFVVLEDALAVSDQDGIASFDDLKVVAANSKSFVLAFACLGSFEVWNPVSLVSGPAGSASVKMLITEMSLVEQEDRFSLGYLGTSTQYGLRAIPRDVEQDQPWATRGKSVEGEVMENVFVRSCCSLPTF